MQRTAGGHHAVHRSRRYCKNVSARRINAFRIRARLSIEFRLAELRDSRLLRETLPRNRLCSQSAPSQDVITRDLDSRGSVKRPRRAAVIRHAPSHDREAGDIATGNAPPERRDNAQVLCRAGRRRNCRRALAGISSPNSGWCQSFRNRRPNTASGYRAPHFEASAI